MKQCSSILNGTVIHCARQRRHKGVHANAVEMCGTEVFVMRDALTWPRISRLKPLKLRLASTIPQNNSDLRKVTMSEQITLQQIPVSELKQGQRFWRGRTSLNAGSVSGYHPDFEVGADYVLVEVADQAILKNNSHEGNI